MSRTGWLLLLGSILFIACGVILGGVVVYAPASRTVDEVTKGG